MKMSKMSSMITSRTPSKVYRGDDYLVVGGDFNGLLGQDRRGLERVRGGNGVGIRNFDGERLTDLAEVHDLAITSTFLAKRRSTKITYSSGGRETEIDHVLVRHTVTQQLLEGPPFSLLYADDIALLADTRSQLQRKVQMWQGGLAKAGLKLKKTEIMSTGRDVEPTTDVNGVAIRQVDPCEDFYKFACENWIKNRSFPGQSFFEHSRNMFKEAIKDSCWRRTRDKLGLVREGLNYG
ncbi:hypothetical protein Y032_0023g876 [Ancylostoma ceylanicum]|uniref:Reverse transcriptase domain-containing protein n=2 Tax=Ancylostoma ceylanicum TaxID=53326 RepID=A0A016UZB6_9BILA|nr:hypothetical protein Y032_0023g876 [Ancylostoma ceylanicum]